MNILDGAIGASNIPHHELAITLGPLEDNLASRINATQLEYSIFPYRRMESRESIEGDAASRQ
jgi:hypothetical protein